MTPIHKNKGFGLGRPVGITLLFVLGYFAAGIILALVMPEAESVTISLLADLALAVAAYLYWYRRYYGPYLASRDLDEFRWDDGPSGLLYGVRFILWVFLVWYVLQLGAAWLIACFGDSGIEARNAAANAAPGAYILLAVFVAPVTEELFIRGVVMNLFMEHKSAAAGVIVSSLLFGALHGAATYMYFGTAMGLLLATVYLETRELWCCVLAHCVLNILSLVMPVPSLSGPLVTVIVLVLNAMALQSLWHSLSWDCLLADCGWCVHRNRVQSDKL